MNTHNRIVLLILVSSIGVFESWEYCQGYGSIVHWIIAEEVGSDPSYANLPDVWPSTSAIWVSEKFCWSHAAIDMNPGPWIPNTPVYADDGRYPGFDMWCIARYKLKSPSSIALKTAEGFVCHNAADRNVHWTYFEGGTLDNWIEDHQYKELWAEYIVFAWVKCEVDFDGGEVLELSDKMFDANGNVQSARAFTMDVLGDGRLLNLSQKSYRKNGRYTDSDGTGDLDVDTTSTIAQMIVNTSTSIANNVAHLRLRNTLGEDIENQRLQQWEQHAHWIELRDRANNRGWDQFECRMIYLGACINAQQWIAYMKTL